jgi:hypothetical protein
MLKAKWDEQQSRCAYTGTPLLLGVNASLNHILPVSRFPDQPITPDSYEWVTFQVNEFKAGKTREEFLDLIRTIHSHLDLNSIESAPASGESSERHWKLRGKK